MPLLSFLQPGDDFPHSSEAFDYPNGLLAAGGALTSDTLLAAYRRGIFPWYEAPQPVLWWTPDPRSVLFVEELHISRSLRKTLRRASFQLSVDRAFGEVMRACAEPREDQQGTWIDPAMINAYSKLHAEDWAHSVEVWRDGELVGGLYGIALGGVFFGESMFSRVTDASKVAFVALLWMLARRGARVVDCQVESKHLNSLGARNVSRVDFENLLKQTVDMATLTNTWALPEHCDELL